MAGLLAFVVALAGVVAFVSLYVYEDPRHHCPFCLLKAEYGYRGYAFYVALFAATAAALGAGALAPFAGRGRSPASAARLQSATRALGGVALGGFLLVLLMTAWQITASGLTLFPHG